MRRLSGVKSLYSMHTVQHPLHPQPARVIELEAERCSLDSLGAFTDEHYCCPAVRLCIDSNDSHSQMWVGSDSRAKLAALFIQIFTGIQTAPNEYDVAHCSHLSLRYRPLKVSFAQNVRMALRCRIRISRHDAHAGPTAHTS